MSERSWLAPLVDRGHQVTAIDFRGGSWDCATDGHAMLVVQGATLPRRYRAESYETTLERLEQEARPEELRTTLAALLDWARAAGGPTSPCTTCNGGAVTSFKCPECSGRGTKYCYACGHVKGCEICTGGKVTTCPYCTGAKQMARGPQPGELLGHYVDRLRLQRWLAHLDAGDVVVTAGERSCPLWFAAATWVLALAPLDPTTVSGAEAVPFTEAA
jgi:hypothetical protein